MNYGFFQLAYLGPGGPEFLLIMLVLLLMFGAKEAPRILRTINEFINHIRSTADGFKREVMYGDLKAEPPEDEDEEEDFDASDFDEDLEHNEDFDYGDEDAGEQAPGDIERKPDAERSEDEADEEDDARKD
jgi:Sec-independent protein translocase protein TatA